MADIVFAIGGARGPTGLTGATGANSISYNGPFSGLPAPSAGLVAIVTDVGVAGSLWQSSATLWTPLSSIVLAENNVAQNFNTTGSHTIQAIPIQAGVLQVGNSLKLYVYGSCAGSTNSKNFSVTMQLQSGGSSFTLANLTTTTNTDTTICFESDILIRTSASQFSRTWPKGNGGSWSYTTANQLGTIDTTQAINVNIRDNLAAAETLTLEAYKLILFP